MRTKQQYDEQGPFIVLPPEIEYPEGLELEIERVGDVITIRPAKDSQPEPSKA